KCTPTNTQDPSSTKYRPALSLSLFLSLSLSLSLSHTHTHTHTPQHTPTHTRPTQQVCMMPSSINTDQGFLGGEYSVQTAAFLWRRRGMGGGGELFFGDFEVCGTTTE